MYVLKRDGRRAPVMFDKISSRIQRLCYGLNTDFVDYIAVSQKVCNGVYRGVSTTELDELAAETAANMSTLHPDFNTLAARIAVSNLHKCTKKCFSEVMYDLYSYLDPKTDEPAPLVSQRVYEFIRDNATVLDNTIVYTRDFNFDYFGFKTLERAYLFSLNGAIAERPQHMLMRVACGIHCGDIDAVIETYNLMSEKWFIHASPTLFNCGTPRPQLSSCFLISMKDDSIEGIYDTLKTCAQISKSAGGIGLSIHQVRSSGAYIKSTNGTSNGIIPMLRVYNATARYVDQGGGKRKGAFALYLEPWHPDIFDFIEMRKNHGNEERRGRDLFYGLWIPDLFMKRVDEDGLWTFMDPHECPGLPDVWGDEFEQLYEQYERQGKGRRTIKARKLWSAILDAQQETGNPYMLFKDSANRKSNQQNLGTIRSSNLCTEIIEYTAPDEVAVCNLASLSLPRYVVVDDETGQTSFNFQKLMEVTKVVTRNLNKIIDVNYYPVPEAEYSNKRHRPIGIGVQGLADVFILLRLPYESPEAQLINKQIFAAIYYAALQTSIELAVRDGPYVTYEGSPLSKGLLQYDLWNLDPHLKNAEPQQPETINGLLNWDALKTQLAQHGARNSLLLAPMPTASTSQILGNNESFEPYTSNLYVRRTLAGDFICVSNHLLRDLIKEGIWNEQLKNKLIAANGSCQSLVEIPARLRELYKTVWEMSGRTLIEMSAHRGRYIDQSQSLNVHMNDVNHSRLTSLHFTAWRQGLKTGLYYLRTRAATDAIKFTLDPALVAEQAAREASAAAVAPAPVAAPAVAAVPATVQTETPLPTTNGLAPQAQPPTARVAKKSSLAHLTTTPQTKKQREQEELEQLEHWRRERLQKKKKMEQKESEEGGCTMCSG